LWFADVSRNASFYGNLNTDDGGVFLFNVPSSPSRPAVLCLSPFWLRAKEIPAVEPKRKGKVQASTSLVCDYFICPYLSDSFEH